MKSVLLFLFSGIVAVNLFAQPAISGFSPGAGAIGSTVTITGTNFNSTAAQNIVFFGATQSMVTAATGGSLTVTAPLGATYQYISVTNLATGLTAYTAKPFIVTYLSGSINFLSKADFATGVNPNSVSMGDIDGDGKPDLVVVNSTDNTVSILRNTSVAPFVSFAPKVDFVTVNNPYSVSIGDLDGDGKSDVAVVNRNNATVSVLRNTSTTGAISFATKIDFATGKKPVSVSIGDIDGDGKPDLVVANNGSSTASILRNTSTAGMVSFAVKADFVTGFKPVSVSIGDIDGDGKPDVAVANNGSNTVSVLRNISTSAVVSFAAKVDLATGSKPSSVSIGDIDSDGKPDLVVANINSNTVSVLRNTSTTGMVSFAWKADFTTGSGPASVSIGDIDGDGKPDLAVANINDSTVSVLSNMSTSGMVSFAAKVNYATGSYPVSVSIGDLNGDGQPDLALANDSSNIVSVILQPCIVPSISSASLTGQTQIIGKIFMPITVLATGSLITYQWYQNTNNSNTGGSSLATANGAQTNSYTPQTTAIGTLYYYCVVTGICGMPQTTAVSGAFKVTQPLFPILIYEEVLIYGTYNNTLTLFGTNFNPIAAQNIVFVNGTQTIVTAATESELTLIVPIGATCDPLTVTNLATGVTGYGTLGPFSVYTSSYRLIDIPSMAPLASLAGLSAVRKNIAVQVSITTSIGVNYYSLERSQDRSNFTTVGKLAASKAFSYKFTDAGAPLTALYYRIKTIGLAGKINYSNTVKVEAFADEASFMINPNPVQTSNISVNFKNQPAGKYILRFINTIGQLIFTGILQHSGGNSTQTVNLPAGIARGTYQAELHGINGTFSTQTIIINTKK